MTELILPVGRLVGGHPMKRNAITDDRTNPPTVVMLGDGVTPATDSYIGVAILKGAETHWAQTEWGAVIYNEGTTGWPGGEFNAPTFSWKITDGDSAVPNRNSKKPCEREGYPGHWVLQCSTRWEVKCYHKGRYAATQQIQDDKEIKPGDYICVKLDVKGNAPSQSPGVYVNPVLVSVERAGIAIQLGDGVDAATAFGAIDRPLPAGAQIDTAIQQAPPLQQQAPLTNVAPANDFLQNAPPPPAAEQEPPPPPPAENYSLNGKVYSRVALETAGYKTEAIAALQRV